MDIEGDFRELGSIFSGFIYSFISSYSYMSRNPYESERYVTANDGGINSENHLVARCT